MYRNGKILCEKRSLKKKEIHLLSTRFFYDFIFSFFFFFQCISSWNLHSKEREREHEGKFKQKSRSIAWVSCVRICVQPDASDCVQANNQRSDIRIISETLLRVCWKKAPKGWNRSFFLETCIAFYQNYFSFVHFHGIVTYVIGCFIVGNFLKKGNKLKIGLIYESSVWAWNIGFEFRFDYWKRPRVKFSFLSYLWF